MDEIGMVRLRSRRDGARSHKQLIMLLGRRGRKPAVAVQAKQVFCFGIPPTSSQVSYVLYAELGLELGHSSHIFLSETRAERRDAEAR